MRLVSAATLVLALIAACSGSENGASVEVDGTEIDLPDVSAVQIDTFYMLSATSTDGALLELALPTDAMAGSHACSEGRPGVIALSFTPTPGVRFSSVYPVAAPNHACAFQVEETGTTVSIGDLTGVLADSAGTMTVHLDGGSFRAPVTQ